MNMIKRTGWMLMLAAPMFLLFSGCTKFLDRKPLSATLDDLSGGGLEGQAIGLYGAIRNSASEPYVGDGFQSLPWHGLESLRSDDQDISADGGAAQWHQTYDFFSYTKDDWGAGVYWDKHYIFIGLCNSLLHAADSLHATDEQAVINTAEARWFRAFSYFDLVRSFGEVPKIDFAIVNPKDGQIQKSPVADIYALIDADLQFASDNLPDSWDPKFIGRLTKGAAKSLRAKELMYQKQYAQALGIAEEVISSNQYALYKPYWQIFKTEGENCSESIFEIQAYQSAGAAIDFWSWYGTSQGVRGSDADGWNLGWGWNTPTQNLVDAYEPGDPREAATILFSGQSDDPDNGGYGRTLPPVANMTSKYWNKKTYSDPAEQAVVGDPHGAAYINDRILRYADVVLLAAEAANETGDGAKAAGYLEMVRDRARNGDDAVLPAVEYVDQNQMRKAIQHERRIEFAMEHERFFDLVRWGAADSVLAPLGYTPKNKYYPIPTEAIEASNKKLTQNPDY